MLCHLLIRETGPGLGNPSTLPLSRQNEPIPEEHSVMIFLLEEAVLAVSHNKLHLGC